MIGKLICASMLVTSAAPVFSQDMSRSAAAGDRAGWPHMHQCTVTPGAEWHAINTKGTGTSSGRSAMNAAWSRIDLEFTASVPSTGGGIPTVSGFAINTKGTGTSSGRLAAGSGASATVACVSRFKTDPYAEDAAREASADMTLQMPRDARAARWSCSVTGSEDAPQFVLTLLVPTILGQAERTQGPGKGPGASDYSFGTSSNNGAGHRVSIVPHGSKVAGASPIACSSGALQGKTGWDVLILQ